MSSDEIIKESKIFENRETEQNANLFSELNSSPISEEHKQRNSLRTFTLNDILKEDFNIFDKKEEDLYLTNSKKTKYKSIQLTTNDLKDLNFMMSQSTKNSNSKKKLNVKLESIKETSADNKKENDINNNNNEDMKDENNALMIEPNKKKLNNVKKVIKTSGNRIQPNINGSSKNKISTENIIVNEKGSKNNIGGSNIDSGKEKIGESNKIKSESDNSHKFLKSNLANNSKVLDKPNDNLKSRNSMQINKINKQVSKEIKSNTKNAEKIEKDETNKDGLNTKKNDKGIKTHHKSSSISITSHRSSMNSISSKLNTDSVNTTNCDNSVKITNKKSSMLKDSAKSRNLEEKSEIKNVTTLKKTKMNYTQTPVTKKSSTLSTKTDIKDKNKENLSGSSTVIKSFDKSNFKKISTNTSTTLTNKNQNLKMNINTKSTNYNTSLPKKIEKQNLKSDLNKTSNFTLSERSSTLMKARSKNNYSTVKPDMLALSSPSGSKSTKAQNPTASLIKFQTSKHFNKASSLPKKLMSPLIEIKESKNEFATNAETKREKVSSVNVQEFYSREMDYLQRRKKKIEELAEKSIKMELKNVLEVPEICKASRKIAEKNTNDFYTRQTTFSNKIESKIKEKIEEQNKKETDMIEKINQKFKGKKIDINRKYENLLNWQKEKSEVIQEKQKREYETQIKSCTFKPEIDQNSKKIANIKRAYDSNTGANPQDTVSRLYKDETLKRKHKNEILKNIYTPTFSPMVNTKVNFGNHSNYNNTNYPYMLTHDNNNNFNNSFNNNLNNTTCNTITGLHTARGNARVASACGAKDYDKYKNQFLYGTLNSNSSKNKNNNINYNTANNSFYEHVSMNMRKFNSQNRYMNSRENSAQSKNGRNDLKSNRDENDNRMNASFQSERNGDGKGYYRSFFTEAAENPRELGSLLKEKFENVFKKYNMD